MNFFFLNHIGFHLLTDLEEHTQEDYILVGRVEKGGWKASVLSQFDRSGWQHENLGPREGSGEAGGEERQKGWPCLVSQMSGPPPRLRNLDCNHSPLTFC